MKIKIDGKEYFVDAKEISIHLAKQYEKNMFPVFKIGKIKIDLSKGSLTRLSLKALVTSTVIPILTFTFNALGDEIPKPEQKEDMISYAVRCYLTFMGKHYDKMEYSFDTEYYDTDIKKIVSYNATIQENTFRGISTGTKEE